MVILLTSRLVDLGLCFSTKHAALRSKTKDYLTWNWDNMSECDDMTTHGLLFQ